MQERSFLLRVTNATADIESACLWLESCAAEAGASLAATSRLQVVLDEVLSNLVKHGLPPDREHGVGLSVRRREGRIELEVIDDGPAFDAARPIVDDRSARIRERRPGGVGLLFVHRLMDEVRFSREEGRNRLTLALRLPPDKV